MGGNGESSRQARQKRTTTVSAADRRALPPSEHTAMAQRQSVSPVSLSGSSAALWFGSARCRRRPRRIPTSARRAARVRTHGHWRAGCVAQRTQYRHDGDRDTGPDQNAAQLAKCVDHRPVPRGLTCVLGAASEASSSSMSTGPGSIGFHREMEIQSGWVEYRPRSPASRAAVNGRRRNRHRAGVPCWPRSTNAITSCRADSRANGFAGPGFQHVPDHPTSIPASTRAMRTTSAKEMGFFHDGMWCVRCLQAMLQLTRGM